MAQSAPRRRGRHGRRRGAGPAPWSACRTRRSRSASAARRWNTFWATVCDSRKRAGASTVVRASTIERTASRPSRSRQPAARQCARPYSAASTSSTSAYGPTRNHAGRAERRADQQRPQVVAAGGAGGRALQPARVVGQLGQELVQQRLDVAHAHEREQRARRGGLVGVARDLHGQRRQPERAPEDALDDPHRAHPRDRHRGLAALDQPAPDPQPVAVADQREAAEGHERARGREQPGEHEQRRRRRAPRP